MQNKIISINLKLQDNYLKIKIWVMAKDLLMILLGNMLRTHSELFKKFQITKRIEQVI